MPVGAQKQPIARLDLVGPRRQSVDAQQFPRFDRRQVKDSCRAATSAQCLLINAGRTIHEMPGRIHVRPAVGIEGQRGGIPPVVGNRLLCLHARAARAFGERGHLIAQGLGTARLNQQGRQPCQIRVERRRARVAGVAPAR